MAWTNSKFFRQYIADITDNITAIDWPTDASIKGALYNNTITPDNDVTAANSAYNVGQWASAQEVADGAEWAAGGLNLGSRTIDVSVADFVKLSAANLVSGTSATLTNATGVLVYADTIASPVADQGICYNYLGGPNSLTDGTFTVVWSANGVARHAL